MKKIVFLLCGFAACMSVKAQNEDAVDAKQRGSRRTAIGIEASFTGLGLEISAKLNPHIAVRGGLSMLPLSFKTDLSLPLEGDMRSELETYFARSEVRDELTRQNLPRNINDINTSLDLTASLGLVNGKLLVDLHPSKRLAFRGTVGLYFGKNKLINVDGKLQQPALIQTLTVVDNITGGELLGQNIIEDYNLGISDLNHLNAAISIRTVKPYVGIGFGRAVPKRRVGVSFDMGALFWGEPAITSKHGEIQKLIDKELDGVGDLLKNFSIFPVMALRINIGIY